MDVDIHSKVNGSSLNEIDDKKNKNGIMKSNVIDKLLNEKEGEKNEETSGSQKEEINGIEKEKDNKEKINGTPKEEKKNEETSEINKEEIIEIKKEEDNKEETNEIKKEEEKNEEINGIEKNKETNEIEKVEEKNEEKNRTPKEDNKEEIFENKKIKEKNEEINGTPKVETSEIEKIEEKNEERNGTQKEDNKEETSEIEKIEEKNEEINGTQKEDNKVEINETPKEEEINETQKGDNKVETNEIEKIEEKNEEINGTPKEDNKEEIFENKKEEEIKETPKEEDNKVETSEIEKTEEKNEDINETPKEEDNKVEINEIKKEEDNKKDTIEIKKEEEINGTQKEDNKVETSEIEKVEEKNEEINGTPKEDNKVETSEIEKVEDKSLSNIKTIINELEVYDIIIDINAMKSLFTTGWKEYSSQKGRERYEEKKDKRSVVVSVIGNKNKGKSFFLSKISGIDLPSGYSVVTKGLSVKYPQIEKQNIILLDTAGFETPLVQNEVYQLENDIKAKDEKYNQEIRELARDREVTEYFLQKFVLTQANILVCLVGQLTFYDQKFLSKIRNECGDKTLFILHNLQNLTTLHEVDQYINEVLKCSLTFKLKENKYMDFENKSQEIKENNIFYTEIYEDIEKNDNNKDEKDIVHLIMARENTEAGDYYNNSTIKYIKNQIVAYIGIEKFPVKQKIKDFLFETSKEIMEEGIENEDEIKIIEDKNEIKEIIEEDKKQKSEKNKKKKEEDKKEDENEKKEEEEVKSLIKLYPKPNKKYKLKKYLIDELGQNVLVGTAFRPKYRYYKDTQNNKFIIQISMCGGVRNFRMKPKIVEDNNYFHIEGYKTFNVINPKEEIEKPEYMKNIREHGFFDFDIIVSTDEVVLANHKYKVSKEYGIITFEFDLFDNKEYNE